MKKRKRDTSHLIERVLHPSNLTLACKEVVQNKGAGGVDGMKVSELKAHLDSHSNQLVKQAMEMQYLPQPIRGKDISKGGGKTRPLGIPTVIDRMMQQAVARVVMMFYESSSK